ncbi:MAG: hypothetical protein QGH74_09640, partial [Candidatus Brocadiia bacterium]|nr:hypothetical protein [Candidatus Brocadiia bacterium]
EMTYSIELKDKWGDTVAQRRAMSLVLPSNQLRYLRSGDWPKLPDLRPEYWLSGNAEEGPLPRPLAVAGRRGPTSPGLNSNELPDDWSGYDSMAGVILGPLSEDALRPRQVQALRSWVETGGILLLAPGSEYDTLRGSPLEPMLPVRIFGARRKERLALKGAGGLWKVTLSSPINVAEVEPLPGTQVLYRDGELPMVVRRRLGRGAVCFMAFPADSLRLWAGRHALLADLLLEPGPLRPFRETELAVTGVDRLGEVAGAEIASPSYVVASLGGYFLAAALVLWLLRRRGRAELAWAVILPLGLLVAFVSYRVGLKYQGKIGLSVNEFGLATGMAGSSRVLHAGLIGVHSAQQTTGLLRAEDSGTLLAGERGAGTEVFRTETFETEPRFELRDCVTTPGGMTTYGARTVMDLEGSLKADLQLGEDGVSGTIRNATGVLLADVMVVAGRYPVVVGNLPDGQTRRVELANKGGGFDPRGDFATSAVLGSQERMRKAVVGSLRTPHGDNLSASWVYRPHVLAWIPRPFSPVSFITTAGKPVVRGQTLLCLEAPVRPAAPGTKVTIPAAFIPVDIRFGQRGAFKPIDPDTGLDPRVTLGAFLPAFAGNVSIERAEVQLSGSTGGIGITLSGRDTETGELVRLKAGSFSGGRWKVEVKDAGRFFDTRLNALVLELQLEGGRTEAGALALSQDPWHLRDVSVTIHGTAQ